MTLATGVLGLVELIADTVSVGIVVTTPEGGVVWVNQALRELTGARGNERDAAGLPLREARDGGGQHAGLWRAPDGTERWLQVTCRQLPATGPDERFLLYEVSDDTAQHELEEQGRQRDRRLFRVEELARAGTWDWDLATDAVTWSDELLGLFGYPPGTKLDYYDYRSLLHPEDTSLIEETLAEAIKTTQPFSYTHRMYLADRVTLRVFRCYGEVVADSSGLALRVLGAAQDITEQKRVQTELAYLAEHDPLTGLPNRRSVTNHLRERLDLAPPFGALLMVDIDNFKVINDLHGHVVGDHVLRGLAPLMLKRSDPRALLGRIGGDEFAVLLPYGDAEEVLAVAESLCESVAGHPFVAGGVALQVTVSIGVAPLSSAQGWEVLLANADLALYEAKWAGGNRASLFAPQQMHPERRVSVLQRVHDALDGGLMALDAQPIVDLATLEVTGYELLLRMRDGLDPRLGPDRFLPSVERTDLMLRIDRWVIERAVEALRITRDTGLRLNVNVSSRSLEHAGFSAFITEALRAGGVEPARLGFEITEAAAITNLDAACDLAERLRAAGCRFTLDDFGAGFGSFVYLKHVPFNAVKIAGALVRQADRTATDTVLVEAAVRAARGLGMRTIAEQVDREPLVHTLRQLGVDAAQGHHLGRPRPLGDVLRSL